MAQWVVVVPRHRARRLGLLVALSTAAAACGSNDDTPGGTHFPDTGLVFDSGHVPFDSGGDVHVSDVGPDAGPDTGHDTSFGDTSGGDTSGGEDSTVVLDTHDFDDVDIAFPDGTPDSVITFDTGPDDTGGADTADTADAPDASPSIVPVGAPCTSDTDCDPTGAHVGVCSKNLNPPDPTDPEPVCVARACTIPSSGAITRCGVADVGLCVLGGTENECFPACTFNAGSTSPPTGCLGKDGCNYFGYTGSGGTLQGVGYCSGGCTADADCTGGGVCQIADGICVATLTPYTKTLGDTCSGGECPCVIDPTSLAGLCTRFCITGASSASPCPGGYTCEPGVPATDSGGGALFSSVPPGLVGSCFKTCTTNADCASLGGHCVGNSATGSKSCRPGP
jgi:hypothetical protein